MGQVTAQSRSASYRLHQCRCCRRLLLRCHQCLSAAGCYQMDSYHSGPRPHLCQSQIAEGCTPAGSCPMPNTHTCAFIHTQGMWILFSLVTSCRRHSLTLSSKMSSLSSSGSHASPFPSMSRSSCPEFGSMGQLSWSQPQLRLVKSEHCQPIRLDFSFLFTFWQW